jgi:hypothetical protein
MDLILILNLIKILLLVQLITILIIWIISLQISLIYLFFRLVFIFMNKLSYSVVLKPKSSIKVFNAPFIPRVRTLLYLVFFLFKNLYNVKINQLLCYFKFVYKLLFKSHEQFSVSDYTNEFRRISKAMSFFAFF